MLSNNKVLGEGMDRMEKGGGILLLIFDVLAPLIFPNTRAGLPQNISTPGLAPVSVQWGPSAKVQARSGPKVTLWPPAVFSGIFRGT